MAKRVKLSSLKTNYKRALAVATVPLTLVVSLQISAASATEPVPSMLGPKGDYATSYVEFAPRDLTVVGDTLYFTAATGAEGRELWKSDGTIVGTVLVSDINGSNADSGVAWLTAVGNTLFFVADDGVHGTELWAIGTAGFPVLFNLKADGVTYGRGSNPSDLTEVNGNLYFAADSDAVGTELFKHDVASGITTLVQDIDPGEIVDLRDGNYPASSNPTNLTLVGNNLFFTVETDANVEALWKHDIVLRQTVLVKDIQTLGVRVNFDELTGVGNTLYFAADDGVNGKELWMSDGTAAGTALVKDIRTDNGPAGNPVSLTAMGATLFFMAFIGTHYALWKTDSSAIGNQAKSDSTVRVGNTPVLSLVYQQPMAVRGSYLYFSADDGTTGAELWKTDGGSTTLVKEIGTGTAGSSPSNFISAGSTLYFSADDGATGTELWKSDGSAEGTARVTDINTNGGSGPGSLTVFGSKLFFVADNNVDGYELWSLAPTPTPTPSPTNTVTSSPDSPTPTPTPSSSPTAPVVPEPSTSKVVRFSRFVADSGKLPALASEGIARTLSSYSAINRVVCTGFTSGLKGTALGRKIALQRAQNACNVAKRSAPKALIQVRVNVASGVGPEFRRVQISITGN